MESEMRWSTPQNMLPQSRTAFPINPSRGTQPHGQFFSVSSWLLGHLGLI